MFFSYLQAASICYTQAESGVIVYPRSNFRKLGGNSQAVLENNGLSSSFSPLNCKRIIGTSLEG